MKTAEQLIDERIKGVSEASVTLAPTSDAVNTVSNSMALLTETGKQLVSTKAHLKDMGLKLALNDIRKIENSVDSAFVGLKKLMAKLDKYT